MSYGSSPIGVCASVQPIDEENGTVYYKKLVAQTTKGTVTSGDDLMAPDAAPDSSPRGFASSFARAESMGTTTYGVLTYSVSLDNVPVRPFTVTITVGGLSAKDTDGDGYLKGYNLQGTVNYTSGAVALELGVNVADASVIYGAYQQDYEAASDIPKVIMKLATKNVMAHVYALKDTIGLESAYALRRRFGVVAEDEVATDLVSAINAELMTTLVYLANLNSQGSYTWSNAAGTGVSYFEHKGVCALH